MLLFLSIPFLSFRFPFLSFFLHLSYPREATQTHTPKEHSLSHTHTLYPSTRTAHGLHLYLPPLCPQLASVGKSPRPSRSVLCVSASNFCLGRDKQRHILHTSAFVFCPYGVRSMLNTNITLAHLTDTAPFVAAQSHTATATASRKLIFLMMLVVFSSTEHGTLRNFFNCTLKEATLQLFTLSTHRFSLGENIISQVWICNLSLPRIGTCCLAIAHLPWW